MDIHTAGHRRAVACAPHHATVATARSIFAEGGNAIEAMIAMAASIAAVYPHMNHLGGDAFWLVREPSGRVRALMGAGPAGALARPALYHERSLDAIPTRGPLAALTVPGAVATWMLAQEAARAFGGRLPLATLIAPAIEQAQGYVVSRSQAELTAAKFSELADVPGFARTFLQDGKPPQVGAKLAQAALAATLEQLVHAGLDDFYRGDVGREIAADLEAIGSPVTRADLEAYRALIIEPLSVRLEAATVLNTPPSTQGLASLIILGLFERLRVREAEGFDHVHGIVEATKRAFRVRDRFITDPDQLAHAPQNFLEPAFLDAELRHIDPRKAARWPAGDRKGDTIWMAAADASGLVVSFIQSLYWEFGSGCVLPRTGLLMQNRGSSFSLDPGALNALAPGRRPFHTLNPAMALFDDGRVMAYGAMGGDGQPQYQAAVFTRYARFRQPLGEAVDRPRWLFGRNWGAARTNLRLEPRFDARVLEELERAGHDVEVLSEPYSDTMGHAGGVVLRPDGTLEGAHDPRADGGADGI